jgi:uncharacterized membrane protein
MATRKPTPERVGAFSDGVLAIIITIMVLELKAPRDASLGALMEQWPTFLSYALSYLFVGVFWMNHHHHLFHHTERAEPTVIWANLFTLFFVSLIPFFTAYMAETRISPFTTSLYAGIFLLITVAFMLLQKAIALQFGRMPSYERWIEPPPDGIGLAWPLTPSRSPPPIFTRRFRLSSLAASAHSISYRTWLSGSSKWI